MCSAHVHAVSDHPSHDDKKRREALEEPTELRTQLPDLGETSLEQLWHQDGNELMPFLQILFSQVERPRANLGSTGPPGRVD